MDRNIKRILKKLINNGYEAFIVGGYVRDYLLDKVSYDIDICTNALPEEVKKIFHKKDLKDNFGSVSFSFKNYNFDITTYRKELKYEKRKPIDIEYVDTLEEDLVRRDFTINALCMDIYNNIIDLFDGIDDLNKKSIKIIGDANKKLVEDPLRILRAIRFSAVLDFEIDKELDKSIKKNNELVKNLSDYRIREELTKILQSKNFLKGLELLKEYKILELLDISYNNIEYSSDIYKMWAQLIFEHNYGFTKSELENIMNLKKTL